MAEENIPPKNVKNSLIISSYADNELLPPFQHSTIRRTSLSPIVLLYNL
jgi:hypothetical protein